MSKPMDHSSGDHPLIAEYALGILSPAEHERIGRLIETDSTLRGEYDFWLVHFSRLDAEFAPVPAPAHIYGKIERRLFGTGGQARVSLWESLAFWRALASGALAVALLAIGFSLVRTDVAQPPEAAQQLVAMLEETESNVRMMALYDGTGELRLTTLAGQPGPDRDYELWVIEGGNAPKSMGIVSAAAPTVITLSSSDYANWAADALLAITLEPLGGGPGGIPTGPVVAKGTLNRI